MGALKTELGKIFCKYNEAKDNYDIQRVTSVNGDSITLSNLDYKYHIIDGIYESFTKEEYNDYRRDWIELKSDGLISLSNIISVPAEEYGVDVKDIILIYFRDDDTMGAVARQGITNMYAEMAGMLDICGMSVTDDSVPAGFTLMDFVDNHKVINSTISHVYKTDCIKDIVHLVENDECKNIFKELFDNQLRFKFNTIKDFEYEEKEDDCINGFCSSLTRFIDETGFLDDVKLSMGINKIDIELENNKELSIEDKALISTLFGGIRMKKAIPLKFGYDIDMNCIKMKYCLVSDINNDIYIIYYTEFDDQIDPVEFYNLTEERTIKLHERLSKIVKAYSNE